MQRTARRMAARRRTDAPAGLLPRPGGDDMIGA
jgi:hypothetical protein